ncbi:uncharacterized protein LOC120343362 [Styela clava]
MASKVVYIIIFTIIFCAIFNTSHGIPGDCPTEDSSYCNAGECENSTEVNGTHYCVCNFNIIGVWCNATWTLTASVSVSVPEVNNPVTFTIESSQNAQVNLTSPKHEVLTASAPGPSFVYKYIVSSVSFSDIGEYNFDAFLSYEGLDFSNSALAKIDYVLTVEITPSSQQIYFQKGDTEMSLTVNVITSNDNFTNVTVLVTKDAVSETVKINSDGKATYNFDDAISTDDSGTYLFTATEKYGEFTRTKTAEINVTVEVPAEAPTIGSSGNSLTVTRGSGQNLTCNENGGNPTPTVMWLKDGKKVLLGSDSSTVYQTATGVLVFSQTVPFDAGGNYTCTAQNYLQSSGKNKTASISISITIEGKPELINSGSNSNLQNETVTFSCDFDAWPSSSISWIFNGTMISDNEQFSISTKDAVEAYRKNSELKIRHSALCLGSGVITCSAKNKLNTKSKDFDLNKDPYGVYKDFYIIFPAQEKIFTEAENYCIGLGGNLVDIHSVSESQYIEELAESNSIAEFFIGLKYNGTDWQWTTNTIITYTNWATTPTSGCGLNVYTSDTWSWKAEKCNDQKRFACKVKADRAPTSLSSNPDKCDGTKANVVWTTGGYFNQSIEITPQSVETEVVSSAIKSKEFISLAYNTPYNVKVYTGVGVCSLQPYAETSFTSAFEKASDPVITVTDNICNSSWTYPESRRDEVQGFKVVVTERENVANSAESTIFNETTTDFNNTISQANPNSLYKITVQTLACIGNSDVQEKSCTTPVAAPDSQNINLIETETPSETDTSQGIPLTIQSISERNGKIECLYVVGRYRPEGDAFSTFQITDEMFNGMNEYTDDLTENQDYIAFAVTNNDRNITIGDGANEVTSCPSGSRRKKRATVQNVSKRGRNGPLKVGNYQFYIITATKDGNTLFITNGPWTKQIKVNAAPTNPIVIVLPIVIIILIIIIIILIVLLWRKRQNKKEEQTPPPPPTAVSQTRHAHINAAFSDNVYENPTKDTSIAVENLRSTYQSKHADEDRLFREEYRALATEVSELNIHYSYAMAPEVREKNRFSNIHPANESRVVLRREGTFMYSDYINASYIDGYRQPRKFIAAQGPLPNTMSDFWYMVWEQESTVIVMLTRVNESGRKKCEKYWPDNREQSTFENLIVSSVNEVEYGPIVKRTFELWNPNQSEKKLMVEQFHYITWPDHGVPITTSDLFYLRRMVLESQVNNPSPIIVHCSAGVGRTGTFIALDYLSQQMERESKVDIYGVVFNMRKKRKEMVQTVEQYGLLHKLMLEKHLFGTTDLKTAEFGNTYGSHYEAVDIEDGFYNLSIVPPIIGDINIPEDARTKIRDKDVVPYDHCKVVIRMRPSEDSARFINASFVKTYGANEVMIACQGPVQSNVEDFWRVILDNNVSCIVMLSKLDEGEEEHCSQYWPTNCENPRSFGDITVSMQSETKENEFTERWIQVSEKVLHLRRSLNVMQLQYEKWPRTGVPTNGADILSIIARSHSSKKILSGNRTTPILVHCRDGAGRTGTFCAVANLVERLKNEDRIDIFRTVKDLRDMRPLMVRTLEQYRFCFKTVQEYLDSFQLYANFK